MTEIIEWLQMIFRFVHVLAAIMWVGSSIFFMWLDQHLEKPKSKKEQERVSGELWMIHGGGIFHSQKRVLQSDEIPPMLHWFKWEAYTTWLSGFSLLVIVYFLQSTQAAMIGLGAIILGWLVYDVIWRSAWMKSNRIIGSVICYGLVVFSAWLLDDLMSGKSAFLYVGAMLGTMMAGNVFMHIIPNQKKMLAALEEGKPHDTKLGDHAKLRSTHNNYMTFPVLFLMLSGHFPQMWSNDKAWIILAVMVLALAIIKHWMNIKNHFKHWLWASVATFLVAAVTVSLLRAEKKLPAEASSFQKGEAVFKSRGCIACHQAGPVQQGPSLVGIYGEPQPLVDGTSVIADEAYLRESILEPHKQIVKGYQPIMPPYQGILTDAEVDLLITYIKELHE